MGDIHANETWQDFLQYAMYYGPRVSAALIAGGLIGAENQIFSKPAGLRTSLLVTLAATIITITSIETSYRFGGEPGRITAQILTGIGFVGGGAILVRGGLVRGVTTAATIFVDAGIGITIGTGFIFSGMAIAVLAFAILLVLRPADYFIEHYPPFVKMREADRRRRRARKRPIKPPNDIVV
jgi:putative Mg2+ transporter-C (MgtC) family protein